jgi:starch synthase
MRNPIKVLTLASEAAPLLKIGGLGDVAGTLPQAIRALPAPVDIRLALPYYNTLNVSHASLEKVTEISVSHADGLLPGQVFRMDLQDLPVYLIAGGPISNSPTVYSSDAGEDARKFSFFSLAALELAKELDWRPDILHAHDWHTAPAVYSLFLSRSRDVFYASTATLLTVHNLPYLGVGAQSALQGFGLPPAKESPLPDWAQHLPLPLGLYAADWINTVSEGYAREIRTPEFGSGLEGFLRTRENTITGILNGIDMQSWDPATDQTLAAAYTQGEWKKRARNKKALLKTLDLSPDLDRPLLAMINRMDPQKGVDLVPTALQALEDLGWQAVILGTGREDLEEEARGLDRAYPHVRALIRYDGVLARQIYAGSDAILIPSRYEPCGLTQMIAMRYGCIPIARATGGLRDTITDYHADQHLRGKRTSTGFLFGEADPDALAETIRRALEVYGDKRRWRGLQRRAMGQDFSWQRSAEQYLALYERLLSLRR